MLCRKAGRRALNSNMASVHDRYLCPIEQIIYDYGYRPPSPSTLRFECEGAAAEIALLS